MLKVLLVTFVTIIISQSVLGFISYILRSFDKLHNVLKRKIFWLGEKIGLHETHRELGRVVYRNSSCVYKGLVL